MKVTDPKAYFLGMVGGEGAPIQGDLLGEMRRLLPAVQAIGKWQNQDRGDLRPRIYLHNISGDENARPVDVEHEGTWIWLDRNPNGPAYLPVEIPDPEPTPEPEPDPTPNDIAVLVAAVNANTDALHAVETKIETLLTNGIRIHF